MATASMPAIRPSFETLHPCRGSWPLRVDAAGQGALLDAVRDLAQTGTRRTTTGSSVVMQRFRQNAQHLQATYKRLARLTTAREPIPTESEWLLDNYYIIDDVIREIRTDLPSGYYRELPAYAEGPYVGLPRLMPLAMLMIAYSDSSLSEGELRDAIHEYQLTAPLSIGEMWAVPTMLRLGLLENLRRLADEILSVIDQRKQAEAILRDTNLGKRISLPAQPSDNLVLSISDGLRDQDMAESSTIEDLTNWIAANLPDIEAARQRDNVRHAANQVSIGNAVTSLRLLSVITWREFVEATSLVEHELRHDAIYVRQDFPTRDRCRRMVEQLARGSEFSELEVAQKALEHARAHASDPVRGQVSWYLLGDGREAFAVDLKHRPRWGNFCRDWMLNHPHTMYFGTLIPVVAGLMAVWMLAVIALPWWVMLLAAIPALFVASEVAVGLTNFLLCRMIPPRVLAKLESKGGVPDESATLIVIPTMLNQPEQAGKLLERLEQHYLSNHDRNLWFALLTDFGDAPSEHMPNDEACITALLDGVKRMNARYHFVEEARFFVFHRRRQHNPNEGVWMGWERKRGKLDEFNRLIRGATDTSFTTTSVPVDSIPKVKFVLTLDTDTVMPRDAARQMIATLAHPLNQPQLTADGRKVERGYALLQPRVSFLYQTGFRSWFAKLFAGSAGIDPYSAAVSDTYMDLFGRGTFTGKGLYEVDAFAATAGSAFPENAILSHDLIESSYAHCALASDVEVFDEFPSRYDAYARRDHRWTRGDWQLLPWLGNEVPTPEGPRPNPLGMLDRWKIVDNLRRSFVPASVVMLVIVTWLMLPGQAIWGTLFAMLPFLMPVMLFISETTLKTVQGTAIRTIYARVRTDLVSTLGQVGLQVTFLASHAVMLLDAVSRTIYRLTMSHRKMLEWETAAAVDSRLGNSAWPLVKSMLPGVLIGATAIMLTSMFTPENLPLAGIVGGLWVISPLVAYLVSRPRSLYEEILSDAQRAELLTISRKTWHFFETFVGAVDNHLPPDNFQEVPLGVVAHRTSPTNIGLYLLSTLAAHDLRYIDSEMMIERIGLTLDTVEKLEKHRGHLLNWYDTTNLAPLPPSYVSTVDSGNLLACLLTLKQGLLEKSRENDATADREALELLADRANELAANMDFRFLYNAERELFSIGYNAVSDTLDGSYYDLLASESCITSFLTVARGEVPRKHWFQLGRLLTRCAGEPGLISWGGTMFEYLMPRILLPVPRGVLLDQAQRAVVRRQIQFGRQSSLPWGISESGFYLFDGNQIYQYQSFGVPGMGLKRGLEKDRVIAPYATLMAIDVFPTEALTNLRRLRAEGGEGVYGFYEAIDYTESRATTGKKVVQSYMAHHQGMGLLSIHNRLHGGIMRQRLLAEPIVQAASLLLEERVPEDAPFVETMVQTAEFAGAIGGETLSRRRITTPDTPQPRTHMLSNGRYAVMITNAGSGFSRCGDLDITRWRADRTTDQGGQVIYIRDRTTGQKWSTGYQPTCKRPDDYEVIYSLDKADIRRLDGDIETHLELTVVPDQDVEVRRVTLTNHGQIDHELDLTSLVEVVMNPHAADIAHPAFGKLFLETEWLSDHAALVCRRRPRSADQQPLWGVHVISVEGPGADGATGVVSYETDRCQFIGRRRTIADPVALDAAITRLSCTTGAVLDPVLAIRHGVFLKPGEQAVIGFTTGMAPNREGIVALADQYHTPHAITRAFELAFAHSRIETQQAQLNAEDVHLFQRLAGHLFYPTGPLRAPADVLMRNDQGQPSLWRFGISGDLPITLLRLSGPNGIALLRKLLVAHTFWRTKCLRSDLIVLLENAGGYYDDLYTETTNAIRQVGMVDQIDRSGGVFVRKASQMSESEKTLMLTVARMVLDDRAGSLASQADAPEPVRPMPMRRPPVSAAPRFTQSQPSGERAFFNGIGGFSRDGLEYILEGDSPPAPWSNIIANPNAGFMVTDSGSGFVWAKNSQSNRLTPWSNDQVSDPVGEAIYVQDERTGALWCPTPLPIRDGRVITVRHGQGYSVFERIVNNVAHEMTMFVPREDPIKISLLKLRNDGTSAIKLNLAYYAEWVLGTQREATASHLITEYDTLSRCLIVRNRYNPDFPTHVGFMAASLESPTITGDRVEFVGRQRSLAQPIGMGRLMLSGRVGARLDPCGAIRGSVEIQPGQEISVVFVIGHAPDVATAIDLSNRYTQPQIAEEALLAVVDSWDTVLDAVTVQTPDLAFDLLMNRWLLTQALSCRFWGRSAFYQSGGAYGFRDQLQDVCSLVYSAPDLARAHILRAAGRQFIEGDVQHWWHEPAGNGVRTRFSDDFMWLPYTLCHYSNVTGDTGVFDVSIAYLTDAPLGEHEHERYSIPQVSSEYGSLYDHCLRAFAHGWKNGEHGLPLMGIGDWNDGMNTIGDKGKGESVWVAWFRIVCLQMFIPHAIRRGDMAFAKMAKDQISALMVAIETHGYDGAWYLRAYFDDGTPLGSIQNDECKVDSLTQSWAVIAGTGDPARASSGMDAVERELIKPEERLVLLFTPPFSNGPLQPGYIKGYVPGVRENGGQYTHAACWVVKALAMLGRSEAAYRAFDILNPIRSTEKPENVARYRGEPYVIAADVYGMHPNTGRAGWTWYTGSAPWLYRVGLEDILGVNITAESIRIAPCIPPSWPGFSVVYRDRGTIYRIEVKRDGTLPHGTRVWIDDQLRNDGLIPRMHDGNEHHIRVEIGDSPSQSSNGMAKHEGASIARN